MIDFPDNQSFSFEISDMTTIDCVTDEEKEIQFAVSKKLIKEIIVNKDNLAEQHIYLYLRDKMPMVNPMDGIYILKTQYPKELKTNKN